jgi:hypothetical protein
MRLSTLEITRRAMIVAGDACKSRGKLAQMMAPFVYEQARANAPFHVQIWRGRVESPPNKEGSSIRVIGRIVRIFRNSDPSQHWGQRVSFSVPIIGRAGSANPTLDGTIRHAWEWLVALAISKHSLRAGREKFIWLAPRLRPSGIRRDGLYALPTRRDFFLKEMFSSPRAPLIICSRAQMRPRLLILPAQMLRF